MQNCKTNKDIGFNIGLNSNWNTNHLFEILYADIFLISYFELQIFFKFGTIPVKWTIYLEGSVAMSVESNRQYKNVKQEGLSCRTTKHQLTQYGKMKQIR